MTIPFEAKSIEVDLEQAAAESEQDRRDHHRLAGDVAELLAHDDAMRVPIAVRRLVDTGVEPIVVAKTLAIGDRDGGLMYRPSTRAGAFALAEHEAIAVDWIMSARMGDVGTLSGARFSQAAVARVGQAVALAVGELVQALFEAVLP